jgi:calcium permeable stress-gated cation channel
MQSQPPMANWYYGVLNTGKKRYGHPALNGVLPEPWLPIKKGQSLVNNARSNTYNGGGSAGAPKREEAVLLTLRKRPSLVNKDSNARRSRVTSTFSRRGIPPPSNTSSTGASGGGPAVGQLVDTGASPGEHVISGNVNPWEDIPGSPGGSRQMPLPQSESSIASGSRARGRSSLQTSPLSHRLSFDPGSGVITLPDDSNWMGAFDDVDESDDDGRDEDDDDEGELDSVAGATAGGDASTIIHQPYTDSPTDERPSGVDIPPFARRPTTISNASSASGASHRSGSMSPAASRRLGGIETPLASSVSAGSVSSMGTVIPSRFAGSQVGGDQPASPTTSTRNSRYGTYFHHPEKRRRPIPGAFPI